MLNLFLQECFRFALPGIPHAVDLLVGVKGRVQTTHRELQLEGKHHTHSHPHSSEKVR